MDKSRKRTKNTLSDEMNLNNKRKVSSPLLPSSSLSSPSNKLHDENKTTNDIDNSGGSVGANGKVEEVNIFDEFSTSNTFFEPPSTKTDTLVESVADVLEVVVDGIKDLKPFSEDDPPQTPSTPPTSSLPLPKADDDQVDDLLELYEKIEKIAVKNGSSKSGGLWWNFFLSEKEDLHLHLTPDNILVNFIFQTKLCCGFFYNDDLFNYTSIDNLFKYIKNNLTSNTNTSLPTPTPPPPPPDNDCELDISELLLKFTSTTDNELFMRALLIATETKMHDTQTINPTLDDMRIYENMNNGKLFISGAVNDWKLLKKLLQRFENRCKNTIENVCPEQSQRLLNINSKITKLVDKIIEQKLGIIIGGEYWDDLLWYHYNTFEFSGVLCDLALTTTFKHSHNIYINTVLHECARVVINETDALLKRSEYDIMTIPSIKTMDIGCGDVVNVLDNNLALFKINN